MSSGDKQQTRKKFVRYKQEWPPSTAPSPPSSEVFTRHTRSQGAVWGRQSAPALPEANGQDLCKCVYIHTLEHLSLYKSVLQKLSRCLHTGSYVNICKREMTKCTLYGYESVKAKAKSLSRVRLFVTPWTVAYQAPLSMGFSRQDYWSGLPFPSPGDLPDPGTEPRFPTLEADSLTWATGSPYEYYSTIRMKQIYINWWKCYQRCVI